MRKTLLATVAAGLLASGAQAQGTPKAQPPAPAQPAGAASPALDSDDAKTIYAFGYNMGKGLGVFGLSAAEFEIFQRALLEGNAGTPPAVEVDQYAQRLQALTRARQAKVSEMFLEKAAQEKGAVKLPSGVVYKELKAGTGPSPKAADTVSVHYRGTLTNGEEFDSSIKRNQPAEFPLNGVIKCWTEGVQKMKVGTKAKLTCPAKTAYAERPPTGSKIPPNAVLEFEVELLGIPGDTSRR
ncbi:FKBP-type peptidyl-prolyl cis-trans isomerase [Stigmatella aurantiaca]|uniref:Peptidyl-prolyl cis-trans isomerase n=1 Tax=Stigmatella aurantiaca (strain DW4/3-1) TaxID=378806 RepID=Q091U0_STIAD|nr:FKBP-type peptidyl-prolyl cis-trans isomerase [Stigmatella aurantiaca]ADO71906.1 Peptidyl-prolyl cis-trans isomerase [Stigmatella aurantiaca DW4/3-1]EAU66501.1 fkbp-type peptidyl-prolyl cis-trans isomerase fkpa [Stigmatella aurantiaca DW4/3-1]